MAQFTVYANPNPRSRERVPYLVDVQSDLIELLATRVVVPLVAVSAAGPAAERLNPVLEVMGQQVLLSTAEIAGVPRSALGEEVGSLAAERDRIIGAVDFLLCGI